MKITDKYYIDIVKNYSVIQGVYQELSLRIMISAVSKSELSRILHDIKELIEFIYSVIKTMNPTEEEERLYYGFMGSLSSWISEIEITYNAFFENDKYRMLFVNDDKEVEELLIQEAHERR